MSLDILIDHTKLSDSPFDELTNSIFDFTTSDTEGFVQEIVNGNPTCYLISGYRGAGKSSFIKKLEVDIKKRDDKTLFVYLNFAKHEERSILLRKLIRNFYLSFEKSKSFESLEKSAEHKESISKFKELYERTFYDVSKNSNQKITNKLTTTLSFKANLKDITAALIAFILAAAPIPVFGYDKLSSYLISLIPLFGLFRFFKSEIEKKEEKLNSTEVSKNTFYDDEIAEHYLLESLKTFGKIVKPVFVLDELDKINSDELVECLINELKPIMLSGYASFIVVAGQNLYYDYYFSQTKDDGVLSSLFSKIHHVPLFSISELKFLFGKFLKTDVTTLSVEDNFLLEKYIEYLIFESKCVPRRFINLIRQNIFWENNVAILRIEKSRDELEIYSKILRQIENIGEEIAQKDYPKPIRDYFNMQLLLKAHGILANRDRSFTHANIYNYGS